VVERAGRAQPRGDVLVLPVGDAVQPGDHGALPGHLAEQAAGRDDLDPAAEHRFQHGGVRVAEGQQVPRGHG